MPGARRQGRPCMAWMDNIKMSTGLAVEESVRMTADRDKWRKYVHGVANPRIEHGQRTEHVHSIRTNVSLDKIENKSITILLPVRQKLCSTSWKFAAGKFERQFKASSIDVIIILHTTCKRTSHTGTINTELTTSIRLLTSERNECQQQIVTDNDILYYQHIQHLACK